MGIALRVFFRKVYIRNRNLIPDRGQLIICANHPATFLDPLVIGASVKPELFFLSKGEVFRSPLAQWILPKMNMIPVYRQQDDPSLMHKNKQTFIRCYEHLEKGGSIMIFPEGISLTERKLRKIKTGTARIALGAEARNDFKLGVQIVNIGINYTNPHKFNQELFLNVDTPIEISAYKEKYARSEQEAANELTECIRQSLEQHIIAIEDEQTDDLVRKIEIIYKQRLANNIGDRLDLNSAGDFQITRNIVETVEHFKITDWNRVEGMRIRIDAYFDSLERANLSDNLLNPERKKGTLVLNNTAAFVFVLAGFPFYLFGLVNNWLPFEIPTYISKRFAPTSDFVGAIAVVSGTFCFILFYLLQILLFQVLFHHPFYTFLYAISMPLCGLFAYLYWYMVKDIRSRWLLMSLFYRKTALVSALIKERMEIIDAFDQARDEFRLIHPVPLSV
jgi:glycerol-3-phosphate O-acyltransferase/dihydroxyacetone phosphate acyltransferase